MLKKIKDKWNNMDENDMLKGFYLASLGISAVYVAGYFIRAIKK